MPYNITESATGVFAFLPTPISISRWSIFARKVWGSHPCAIPVISFARFTRAIPFFSLSWFSYLAIEFIVLVIVIFYCLPGKQANFCTSESSKTPRYPPSSFSPLSCTHQNSKSQLQLKLKLVSVWCVISSAPPSKRRRLPAQLCCIALAATWDSVTARAGTGPGGWCSVWGTCKTIINAALLLAIFHLKRVKEAANYPTIQRSDQGHLQDSPSLGPAAPLHAYTAPPWLIWF